MSAKQLEKNVAEWVEQDEKAIARCVGRCRSVVKWCGAEGLEKSRTAGLRCQAV